MQGNQRRDNRENWIQRQLRRNPKPLWMVIAAHVLVLGVSMLMYAVPHHVRPRQQEAVGITSTRQGQTAQTAQATVQPTVQPTTAATSAPAQGLSLADAALGYTPAPTQAAVQATAEPTAAPAAADSVGVFRNKIADKFTDGKVDYTDLTYKSANINVSFSTVRYGDSNVNVADIYVADISNFITVFGSDVYYSGSSKAEKPAEMAARWNGIATLSGDYFGMRDGGVVIRNGMLYRDEKLTNDVCVLYWDGTLKCFAPHEFDAIAEMANGAYQAWNFGPMLLDANGQVMDDYNTDVGGKNPRAILGYYEPGHYCFVTVDGRSDESKGLTIRECAEMCVQAGLKQAYNLDGGQTAAMVKGTELFGVPYKGGRKVGDVLMIVDGAQ